MLIEGQLGEQKHSLGPVLCSLQRGLPTRLVLIKEESASLFSLFSSSQSRGLVDLGKALGDNNNPTYRTTGRRFDFMCSMRERSLDMSVEALCAAISLVSGLSLLTDSW